MEHLNPELLKALAMFGLDKAFAKAEGQYLYDENGVRYTDFFAQNGEPELSQQVKDNGDYLTDRLLALKEKWPSVLRDVRGAGYQHVIEFEEIDPGDSLEMSGMCDLDALALMISGFLLNTYKLRVMPSFTDSKALNILPSPSIERADLDTMLEALDKLCEILFHLDYYLLYRYLVGDTRQPESVSDYRDTRKPVISSEVGPDEKPDYAFAFLCHYPSFRDIQTNTPSFYQFSDEELGRLLEWRANTGKPSMFCEMPAFRSPNGELIKGWMIAVPYGGQLIMDRPREEVNGVIKAAIDKGKELGANVFGLGAYTSIVTRGGMDVLDKGVTLTTGNTFTVIISVEALLHAAERVGSPVESSTAGIIGANGSIGRIGAMLLSQRVPRLVLVGRSENAAGNMKRLRKLANEIYGHTILLQEEAGGIRSVLLNLLEQAETATLTEQQTEAKARLAELFERTYTAGDELPDVIDDVEAICEALGLEAPIQCSVDINESLPSMDLVLSATSTIGEIMPIDKFRPGAVVCDISRPANVGHAVQEARPDVLVIEGGLVQYPEPICFGQNLGYKAGVNLACLSETMLLTFEKKSRNYGIGGRIPIEDVYELQKIGKKHQFSLAALHSFEQVVQDELLERVRAHREKALVN